MKAKEILAKQWDRGTWVHAYLFLGNESGKIAELVDLIVAKSECLAADISKISPENLSGKKGEIKIDAVRDLIHDINLSPHGKIRIAIIENCQKLNSSSANILLKSLEEPPKNVVFILTAERDNVIKTIRSRCQVLKVPSQMPLSLKDYQSIINQGFFGRSAAIQEIVGGEEVEDFLNWLESKYRQELINKKAGAEKLKLIQKTRREISGNANPKLALEVLMMGLNDNK